MNLRIAAPLIMFQQKLYSRHRLSRLNGAEQGFTWSGKLPLSRFARIAREAVGSIDDQSG